jgi:ribosomal protein S18 acetylase RimI-like enzyme
LSLPGLPANYRDRPAIEGDLEAVTAFVAAYEQVVLGEVLIETEDVASDWRRPSFDLSADCVLVFEGDSLLGHAEVFLPDRRAEVNVHPARRGMGLGTWLLGWTERRSREAGAPHVRQTVSDDDAGGAALLGARGYAAEHTAWILEIAVPERPSVDTPDGIVIRDFEPGVDDRAVHRVVEDAFGEWPDREPMAFDDWSARVIRRAGFEPWMLPVAVARGEIVGAANLILSSDSGWVQYLATKATHRHRGIARSLLRHAFGLCHDRGLRTCGLSTDSRTGALGLYEKIGMRVTRSFTTYAKEL